MEYCIAWQDVEPAPTVANGEHRYVQALGRNECGGTIPRDLLEPFSMIAPK